MRKEHSSSLYRSCIARISSVPYQLVVLLQRIIYLASLGAIQSPSHCLLSLTVDVLLIYNLETTKDENHWTPLWSKI
jgi:hypothetical protein